MNTAFLCIHCTDEVLDLVHNLTAVYRDWNGLLHHTTSSRRTVVGPDDWFLLSHRRWSVHDGNVSLTYRASSHRCLFCEKHQDSESVCILPSRLKSNSRLFLKKTIRLTSAKRPDYLLPGCCTIPSVSSPYYIPAKSMSYESMIVFLPRQHFYTEYVRMHPGKYWNLTPWIDRNFIKCHEKFWKYVPRHNT